MHAPYIDLTMDWTLRGRLPVTRLLLGLAFNALGARVVQLSS